MKQVLADRLSDVSSFLDIIRPYCPGNKARFEISWTLMPGKVIKHGRLNYWIDPQIPTCLDATRLILNDLNAPPEVKNALSRFENPLNIGLGFAVSGSSYLLRLYLHGKRGPGLGDFYDAWRWNARGEVKKHIYDFQFHSDISYNALMPCIPALFSPAFKRMTGDESFRQSSGYWIRKGADMKIDNVYLALPWLPAAGQLPGIAEILNDLQIPDAERQEIMNFPVKDFGYKIKQGVPEITIYTPGEINGTIPDNEEALQQLVLRSATGAHQQMGLVYEALKSHSAAENNRSAVSNSQITW